MKSGYKKLMELEEKNEPVANTPSVNELKSMWNAVWKLLVPNRIKLLMWRTRSDSLPIKVNLTKRMLLIEATCNQCNEGPKDTFHALWTCPQLSMVWQVLFPNLVIAADDLARAMVDVTVRDAGETQAEVFENRDIRAMIESA